MIDFAALAGPDRTNLIRLAELLEAGFVTPPFGALALQNHIPIEHVQAVSAFLDGLTQQQMSPTQIALVLRSFAVGRQANRDVSDLIDIVVSGPDAAGSARDTGVVMRQLFNKAGHRVLAVGFAVHQGRSIFQALAERLDADESLVATLCIEVRRQQTDTSLDSQVVERFAQNFVANEWPGTRLPQVYYDPRSVAPVTPTRSALHAKCVVIDGQETLVTSANFTAAAQERNIELGLLVNSPDVAFRVERHFEALIKGGHLERLPILQR
jgi:phosphatidylserine/phosphatidylglycerophosphate/cardiolipin synthase-like enzyme